MKYTEEEMIAMAKSCMWHAENSPSVYTQFLVIMSMHTGESPQTVHSKIVELANK